jgi:hypothetical protein
VLLYFELLSIFRFFYWFSAAFYFILEVKKCAGLLPLYEHIEGARAPHTNGPRDVIWRGALSLLQKPLHYRGGQKYRF